VTAVGNYDESTRLVHTNTSTSIHSSGERRRKRRNTLNQTQSGATFELGHVFSLLGSSRNFVQQISIDFKDRNLICSQKETLISLLTKKSHQK
jgi:hypothetical protein